MAAGGQQVELAALGRSLERLRLTSPTATEQMAESLRTLGQLAPLLVVEAGGGLEVVDGFKRLHAAPQAGLTALSVRRQSIEGENVLDRQFEVDAPNRVWVTDTTYLTTEDGPAFLVAILDLFSRRVVGWTVGAKLDTDLARGALRAGLALRQPPEGLLFHSDRGGEFTSNAFTEDLARAGARRSLSRPGECHDNAPAESFFGTLKDELDINHGRVFASPEDARAVIGEYIEHFYNRQRRHSNNNYLSPVDFEAEARQVANAA